MYSNKLRIEVNNEHSVRQSNEKRGYGYTPAGSNKSGQQRRWNNFGSADSLDVINQEDEAYNNGERVFAILVLF